MTIDETAFRRLQVEGLRKGHLTPDDLKAALPIERMSPEEIARVIVRLQDAGVDVEPEDALLASAGPPRPGPSPGAVRIELDEPVVRAPPPGPRPLSPAPPPPVPAPTRPWGLQWAVIVLVGVALLALVLFLLA